MSTISMNRTARALVVAAACALPAGCVDYTVETTVRPDGGGTRIVQVEATDAPDDQARREALLSLAHLGPEARWQRGYDVEADGDTVFTFRQETEIPTLQDWTRVSGALAIDATTPALVEEKVGYVRLGDVRFRNDVRVGLGRTSDGTTTVTYRETFVWDQAMDLLLEFFVEGLEQAMMERFPRLTAGERGQVTGAFRTRLWMAVDAGVMEEGADEAALMQEASRATARQAARVVRPRYPEATVEQLESLVEGVVEGDAVEGSFGRLAPGMELAFNTAIEFRLRLPGQVISSNADRTEDGVLIWEFGPDDAMLAPVEIQAESVVGA